MSTRSIAVLLLALCLCFQSCAGNRRLPHKTLPCCTKVSLANITSKVIGDTYRKQSLNSRCPEALIFATQGGTVCVNPKAEWAKKLTAKMMKV